MDLIRRPFREIDDFFGEDDWFFPVFKKGFFEPEMDVYETEKEVVAEVNLPDIDPKDVKVEVERDVLKISGGFEKKDERGGEGKNYWHKEIRKESFSRSVRLPAEVDEEKAEANYEKGVLKISLPKAEEKEKRGKEIKIKNK